MKSYNFKRLYHPKHGKFVFKHKGSGLIVDNIFKPLNKLMSKAVSSSLGVLPIKSLAKKMLTEGRSKTKTTSSEQAIRKKAGDLIIRSLQGKSNRTGTEAKKDYNDILTRLVSGKGVCKKKKKKNLSYQ